MAAGAAAAAAGDLDHLEETAVNPRSPCVPALLAALALGAAGCTTVPLAPVPEPLPEALEWRAPGASGAFLGLKTEENDSGSLDALFFMPGARVTRVIENSPASAAGFQPGDVVLALDGTEVNDPAALDALVARRAPGEGVVVGVRRGDTVLDVPVVLAALGGSAPGAPPEPRFRLDPARTRAGWATTPQGVRLASVAPDAPVTRAGLAVGDVVVALDGEPVHSDRDLIRRLAVLEPGTRVRLSVRDAGLSDAGGRDTVGSVAGAGSSTRDVEVTLQEQPTRVTGLAVPVLFDYEAAPDGQRTSLEVIDLWVLSLFEYEREDRERHYTLLNLFGWHVFSFSVGEGELGA
jgi:hypothetical protein